MSFTPPILALHAPYDEAALPELPQEKQMFMYAVKYNHVDTVRQLLEKGLDANMLVLPVHGFFDPLCPPFIHLRSCNTLETELGSCIGNRAKRRDPSRLRLIRRAC